MTEISAKVLCDSISEQGVRLTTLEVTFPRFVLSEFNTHRMFSRNSASSRAIPTAKMLDRVIHDPAGPIEWGTNNAGMQSNSLIEAAKEANVKNLWLEASQAATFFAERLAEQGLHKQIVNRVLEPFLWHTVIVTATDWDNFFNLRISEYAQPEIRRAAECMRDALAASYPMGIGTNQWHTPLIFPEEKESLDKWTCTQVSVARCARVSYLTHDGKRDISKDLELYDRLMTGGHLSPFEHVATPAFNQQYFGNFFGWMQARYFVEGKDFNVKDLQGSSTGSDTIAVA